MDGWPQFSDAIVDFYFNKKLAYYYIRRVQEPVGVMVDEPGTGTAASWSGTIRERMPPAITASGMLIPARLCWKEITQSRPMRTWKLAGSQSFIPASGFS